MSQKRGAKGPIDRHPVEKVGTHHAMPVHLRNLVSRTKRGGP